MFPDAEIILQCPKTGRPLSCSSETELSAGADGPVYPVREGVACLLAGASPNNPSNSIREFYQKGGWDTDSSGAFSDTKAFVDTRGPSINFTRKCIKRLSNYFKGGGKYILDAGGGPIPHAELLDYSVSFEKRVCVDLSAQALRIAQSKLGDRGIYLQGDLLELPLKDNSMDAVTCNHVLYQIPAEQQSAAFRELWRVLKPGGIAVVVYWWPESSISWRLERLAKIVCGNVPQPPTDDSAPTLYHHPHPRSWFEAQDWGFRYKYDTFRVVDNHFMRTRVSDDWRGSAFLSALYALQVALPTYCGKHGRIPAIVFYKD